MYNNNFRYKFVKRNLDIIGSIFLLLLTSPLFFIILILIKLESRGPIFYRQKRCSYKEKVFLMYKFRTMPHGTENGTPVWGKECDSRSTKVGIYLRLLHLDELPQLFNVLKGDMSLVGPRPERPCFIKEFKKSIPGYALRHRVKSGLTGWAQINGFSGDTSIEERIAHDRFYINNWSVLFDLKILLVTPLATRIAVFIAKNGKYSNGNGNGYSNEKYSNGKYSNGKYSNGKYSNGKYSISKCSNGKCSNGNGHPSGRLYKWLSSRLFPKSFLSKK